MKEYCHYNMYIGIYTCIIYKRQANMAKINKEKENTRACPFPAGWPSATKQNGSSEIW